MINAPDSVKNALLSNNFHYADLYAINLGDAYDTGSDFILYYTDYAHDVPFGGETYTPNHALTKSDGISRKASTGSDKLSFSFSVADDTIVRAIRTERYVGKGTEIRRVIMQNGVVLAGFAIPIRTAWGLSHQVEGGDEERVVTLTIDSVLGDLDGDNGWFAINASHQARHSGDEIMKHSASVMTEEQQKRYSTNVNGVINESVKPPALPVIYGERMVELVPICQLKHRKSHTTYRHYFTTWIYCISIGDVVNSHIDNLLMDDESFAYTVVNNTKSDIGGWSVRIRRPNQTSVSVKDDQNLNFWREQMDSGERDRLKNMFGKGLTLLFVKNRNRDNWIEQAPRLTMPVDGIRCFDPRLGGYTPEATRNPALQYADFLRSTDYGAGQRNINVNDANVTELANHFDNLPDSGGDGIDKILFDVQMDTGQPLVDNMNIWMESLRLMTSDYYGEFNIRPETIEAPVWDINETDQQVVAPPEFDSGEFTERINQLTYTIKQMVESQEEDTLGELVEIDVEATFPAEGSALLATWLAEDAGRKNFVSESLDYVTVLEQGFYWAMVDSRISREPRTLELTVGAYGWLMEIGDVIRFTSDILEEESTLWRIDEVGEDDEGNVELSCRAYAAEFYSPDPNAIPDPVAPALPPVYNDLEPITDVTVVYQNGEYALTWTEASSSVVAWYAVEVWIDENTETDDEELLTQVVDAPKVLAPPYGLGTLPAGNYVAFVTPFAPTIEGQRAANPFQILKIESPTFTYIASNFEILVMPAMPTLDDDTLLYEVEYADDEGFSTNVVNLGKHAGAVSILGLTAATQYYVRVRAVVTAGVSDWAWQAITTANDGSIYNNLAGFDVTGGNSVFQATIYARLATVPTTAPTGGQYDFDTHTLTPPVGWQTQPYAGNDPLYASSGIAVTEGVTGIDSDIPWEVPDELFAGGLGADGKSVYQAALYRRTNSATSPTKPADNSATFDFGSNTFTRLPADWFPEIPTGTGRYVHVTYATFSIVGDTGTDATQTWSDAKRHTEDGESAVSVYTYNVYRRSATALTPADTPTGGQYDFGNNTVTPPNLWSATIPDGDSPLYAATTTASVTGATGVDTSLTYTPPVRISENGKTGKSVYTATVYRRSATVLSDADRPADNSASYDFGTNTLTPPTNWFENVPAGDDPVYATSATFSVIGDTGVDNTQTWSTPVKSNENGETGISVYTYSVYRRSATKPATPSGGSYNFSTNKVTAPTNWHPSVPDGTEALWDSSTTASIEGKDGTDTTLAYSDPVKIIDNPVSGSWDHTNGLSAIRTSDKTWTPAVNAQQKSNFEFVRNGEVVSTGTLTWILANTDGDINVFNGLSNLTGEAVTLTIINDNSPAPTAIVRHSDSSASIAAEFYSVIHGEDGTEGQRGSLHFYGDATAWSDAAADQVITDAGLTKIEWDIVTLSDDATGFAQTRYWDGNSWELIEQVLDGDLLVDGTVLAKKINVDDLFAQDVAITGQFTATSGDRVVQIDAGHDSPLLISDAGVNVFEFEASSNKLMLSGGLANETIDSPSVFTQDMWNQIRTPLVTGDSGGTVNFPKVSGGGMGAGGTLEARSLMSPCNSKKIIVAFEFRDMYHAGMADGLDPFPKYTIQVLYRKKDVAGVGNWSSETELSSENVTGYASGNPASGGITVNKTYTFADSNNTDLFPNGDLTDGGELEVIVRFTHNPITAINSPFFYGGTVSQEIITGGGFTGDATTLDGQPPEYYLNYNNFTNTPDMSGYVTEDSDIEIGNHALVFGRTDANNIDHIWYEDMDNSFHFSADTSYRGADTGKLRAYDFTGRVNVPRGTHSIQDTSNKRLIARDTNGTTLRIGEASDTVCRLHGANADAFRVYYGGAEYELYHEGNDDYLYVADSTSGNKRISTGSTEDVNKSGFYDFSSSVADKPAGTTGWLWGIHSEHGDNNGYGMTLVYTQNGEKFYLRGKESGSYRPWTQIYTDLHKPTASDVGAISDSVPSDFWGSMGIFEIDGITHVATNGGYKGYIGWNGYRNNLGGFTYRGVNNNNTTAAGIEFDNTGFAYRAGTASGTALPTVFAVNQDGTGITYKGNDVYHEGNKPSFKDNEHLYFGTDNDLRIYHGGSHGFIDAITGNLYLRAISSGNNIVAQSELGNGTIQTAWVVNNLGYSGVYFEGYYNNNRATRTITGGQRFGSNDTNYVDVKHQGSTGQGYVTNNGAGQFYICNNVAGNHTYLQVKNTDGSTDIPIRAVSTASAAYASLWQGNGEKLRTNSGGVEVYGETKTKKVVGKGTELILQAGDVGDKFGSQTGEFIYANAEQGLSVNTPDAAHSNFESGWSQKTTVIKGDSITVNGNTVYHKGYKPSPTDIGAAPTSHRHTLRDSVNINGSGKPWSAKEESDDSIRIGYFESGWKADLRWSESIFKYKGRDVYHAGYTGNLNATTLDGHDSSPDEVADTVVVRNSVADVRARLFRSSYWNQSTISGAMAYRINDSNDNYIRFCSDTSAIRTWLAVGGTGTNNTWASTQTFARTNHNQIYIGDSNNTGGNRDYNPYLYRSNTAGSFTIRLRNTTNDGWKYWTFTTDGKLTLSSGGAPAGGNDAIGRDWANGQYGRKSVANTWTQPNTFNALVTLPSNKYNWYNSSNAGLDANNSDIVRLNSIYFGDEANALNEGLMFPRSGKNGNANQGLSAYSSLRVYKDEIKFAPDASAAGSYIVPHTGGGTWGGNHTWTGTNKFNAEVTLNAAGKASGTVLLHFDTDREWKFVTSGTGASNQLNLKAFHSSKAFDIVSSNDHKIARFYAHTSTCYFAAYYANSEKLKTVSGGVAISGTASATKHEATNGRFINTSGSASTMLSSTSAKTIYLRPSGQDSTTGQVTLNSSGYLALPNDGSSTNHAARRGWIETHFARLDILGTNHNSYLNVSRDHSSAAPFYANQMRANSDCARFFRGSSSTSSSGSNQVTINSNGGIVATGQIQASTFDSTSALRYKDIHFRETTAESLRKVVAIGSLGTAVGKFRNGLDKSLHRWMIADEVVEVVPEVVGMKNGEVDTLNYQEMLADAYAAIAELTKRLEKLEDK